MTSPRQSEPEYVPLSDDDSGLRVVVFYDPLMGTTTNELADETEFPLRGTAQEVGNLCRRMSIMDEAYWPPVNPIAGRVEGSKVVALVVPPGMTDEGAQHVQALAERTGYTYEDAR